MKQAVRNCVFIMSLAVIPILAVPTAVGNVLTNPGFEETPFNTGWDSSGVVTETGLNGSTTAARLGYNTTAALGQEFEPCSDFTFDVFVAVAGVNTDQSFRVLLESTEGLAIELRGTVGNVLQLNNLGVFEPLAEIGSGSTFGFPENTPLRIRVIGRDFGTENAEYDVAWSDPGETELTHAAVGLTAFVETDAATTGSGITRVAFDRNDAAAHSYWVDDVSLIAQAEAPPTADYELLLPEPPKVVHIAGVYPHLAVTNEANECGIGAVVPWADRLWAVTYSPHSARGSQSKLYEIDSELNRVIRPESLGGTPANRFIHEPSNQLIIGPHFIDSERNVRNLSYGAAPGRHTANAAHLTDPENRVYFFTMEDGVYDVNVHDLSVITRYPDIQHMGDQFLFGYHGKGAYTGQGLLVVANNGRPNRQHTPTGPTGVLATWDGTTVADNGGGYLADRDLNDQPEENNRGFATPQPEYIAGWVQLWKMQHCEVTGPGGIRGNANPETDPVWATGFDANSVVLHVLENGAWHTWRLPKGSYSHDGSHGWHTEWPRIRQIDPADPASPYLMHMHGLFFDFPATFSSTNFAGLEPICGYYKMPVDYCEFEGQLVIAKNDTSKFSNDLVPRAQSNFWFGQIEDLQDWGAPTGHGAVWMEEPVGAGEFSDPFLVNGFSQGTLHLLNGGGSAITVRLESSAGDGNWSEWKSVAVPAGGYVFELVNDAPGEWLRLQASDAGSHVTAFFHLSNPYPHESIASRGTDRYAALADIADDDGYSDGIIRVMPGTDLKLEFASNAGYHQIGAEVDLVDVEDDPAEDAMRTAAALNKGFGSDAASAWVEEGSTRFRLPRLHPNYDSPNLSGWPRALREIVTERQLLNVHGTFYEVPRGNSGGMRKMRALATHGKRITDMASWRGLWVISGVLDAAEPSDSLVQTADGDAALWLGEIDELWKMGEPRGIGGPWKNTQVSANAPSDRYLMYGFDRKELRLSHTHSGPVTFTVEVDVLAEDQWSTYATFEVAPGETLTHVFPQGFHAHWARISSDTATSATAQFIYGPAEDHDELLSWAREHDLSTAGGRAFLTRSDSDRDSLVELAEYVLGMNPHVPELWPLTPRQHGLTLTLRDLQPAQRISITPWVSDDLEEWQIARDLWSVHPDQMDVPVGFTRMSLLFEEGLPQNYLRVSFSTL